MSEQSSQEPESTFGTGMPERNRLSDEAALPPVEPPSAGFIVQLFVVPAIIVLAVVGVYLLFGKLASTEADWRELVADVRHTNPHTRWRGALSLAQQLEADALKNPDERTLSLNKELAAALSHTLEEELQRSEDNEEHQRLLEYLTKSLGWMDVPETVLPVLRQVIDPSRGEILRRYGLVSIGMVAGRRQEAGRPVQDQELIRDLIALTEQPPQVLQHLSAYDLGCFDSDAARQRLEVLLGSKDRLLRLQAVIGLARQGETSALSVAEEILKEAQSQTFDVTNVTTDDEAGNYFERYKTVKQAITAVAVLRDQLSPDQRRRFVELITPLTHVEHAELRHHAKQRLLEIKSSGE